MSSSPQQQAARVLVETFKAHHAFGPADPRDHSTLVVFQEEDGSSMRALSFGEVVDCLAEAGLLVDEDVLEVLTYVSRGRGYVGVSPYPDFAARRALGRLRHE